MEHIVGFPIPRLGDRQWSKNQLNKLKEERQIGSRQVKEGTRRYPSCFLNGKDNLYQSPEVRGFGMSRETKLQVFFSMAEAWRIVKER